MEDSYQTLAAPAFGDFRDRASKFLAYAYPVYTEEEWQAAIYEVKKLHPKARHFCYAYRLGLDNQQFRANDDGEPSGTAGRPILGQIDSFGLTNVIVVVVRYFGGTKLGTSGLINAYRQAAIEAFETATIIQKTVEDVFRIHFEYAIMSEVMNAVKQQNLNVLTQVFETEAYLDFAIRQSEKEDCLSQLRANIAKVRIAELPKLERIEGLEIKYLYTR
ncbi:MAG: YigZ family protein [Saprospiraceae bacterium]